MTDLLTTPARGADADITPGSITPSDVRAVLARSILADGMDLVLDTERSAGSYLVDARTGDRYLDMFTFFASSALGMNHPALTDEAFRAELAQVAVNKPSNSDVYTVPMARFVATFARVLGDPALPHLFFVDGGALAVENALKVAFDWKSRHNEAHGRDPRLGTKVLHLRGAFHGRSGYTLSLTNTDPNKVARFPKFDWPRIDAPYLRPGADMDALEAESLRQARAAFEAHPHDIACFIAEPIQGEGGDRHFRPQFFAAMRELCDEYDALLIFDEVQTGCGFTGTAWAYQQLGVQPDVVAFGKKTQVCGIMAGGPARKEGTETRVDEVADNVFRVSSRINSTWGGNLVDMVRARRILEVIEADGLMDHAAEAGRYLLDGLQALAADFPGTVLDVRGRGLMCAFSLPSAEQRDELLRRLWQRRVIMLASGPDSVRFRPALTVSHKEIDEALAAVRDALS
ncbi:L-lysine 6-transaminase precursor [Mycolicibacterium phlei]|jgi:L-lysine 6-transaminase|uniref:L-lysine-epsilon aminotransferase n=1 Tax=Mycolicibacterium phlei DSM 43239 = CCUG 21000 TaxID=1226750 RepID=A0A5N5V3R0_MYCPH|nr:L-lysine 6-transaminase [Mycolicibacterium phlei]VEG08515.1 L-lysine 6-transaminase precursor [Mycobacteroides chelonae]AMO60395.1 putative L-lysine-epsilon aminotransferase [Mycolicibacterium phlei]EID17721.1 L-lysine aminotransferase [Mycolicibacterium phlei RIVM601174]KAB7756571.1 L-lysine aminotransferase [Mycolicibacterium phlei DSM 43239 = CCUG 21000]KXW61999.1 L-lysine aminotransferase [Mycolicibacterium phlei DSM 43072]